MPTLHRLANCKIEMRSRDHRPAHVHVLFSDGREALIELESGKVKTRQTIRDAELIEAKAWIAARTHELIAQFEEMQK